MRTLYRSDGIHTDFVVADLDPRFHDAIRGLGFTTEDEGFGRRFPVAGTGVEQIYRNFAHYAEELILQKAGERAVPWEQSLQTFLASVAGASVNWYLAGSAALAVRGLHVIPGDIDLVVDDAGAHSLGELLRNDMIEPVVPMEGWVFRWFGRSFLHACLEWAGGVESRADMPEPSDFGPVAAGRLETVEWRGYALRVPPLELQLAVNLRRGRMERADLIRRALNRG
ncbi:MAG: hypothetical protein AVDCRST_MAG26-2513 [uncultured Chloroflexia bacterium]|uniref:Uncharacterized protein n=1 Tax=uncultured Chloroflexia bacterium TaxID=1672391 RepID=A0A6J4IZL4_9CHLR|nr:MAG: hypothetical protein AVDCRST_MAG26-2513 [uncultured Chloroflexia bacterium]